MLPEVIAAALVRVREIADSRHANIIQSEEISRADRELLLATGWLQEIIRGWYMLVRPDRATGDTTSWYANYWDFIRIYLQHRFADDYCLGAESSLDLHVEIPTIPKQVIVIVKQGSGLRSLMHNTSMMIYADPKSFPAEVIKKQAINIMSLGYALCKATPNYFQTNPREAEIALRLASIDELSKLLIRYNLKTAAARLVGAYQFLKEDDLALQLKSNLATVGMLVNPNNPFQQTAPLLTGRIKSPYAGRIQAMWAQARGTVEKHFPAPPGIPKSAVNYLKKVDDIYQYDAYNSLSIEGYQVTQELINKVKDRRWNPVNNADDIKLKDAMAAKGYYDAFLQVKNSVKNILAGENSSKVVQKDLSTWYQQLFGPSVKAGILPAEALFGYRDDRVFIRNSIHSPPPKEAVIDAMESFFACLQEEKHPGVRAVLGHYFFVYIHPYMDGNGRIARFLMNAFLASGGYPWTVVRVDNRKKYISVLENTHIRFDLTDFTNFIKEEMIFKP